MGRKFSLLAILCFNCIFFSGIIMLSVAKWGEMNTQTLLIAICCSLVLGLWNAISFVDVALQKR